MLGRMPLALTAISPAPSTAIFIGSTQLLLVSFPYVRRTRDRSDDFHCISRWRLRHGQPAEDPLCPRQRRRKAPKIDRVMGTRGNLPIEPPQGRPIGTFVDKRQLTFT